MIYVGFFSFDGKTNDDKPMFGHFSCIVEADCPDDTGARFNKLLRSPKYQKTIFTVMKSVKIYQDSLIEVETIPKAGCLLFFSEFFGEEPMGKIDGILPGGGRGMSGFGRNYENEPKDESGPITIPPFMEFD